MLLLLGEAEGAVLARFDRPRSLQADVFEGMAERSPSPVTHCHVSVDFDDRYLAHELECVAPVLPQLVLMAVRKATMCRPPQIFCAKSAATDANIRRRATGVVRSSQKFIGRSRICQVKSGSEPLSRRKQRGKERHFRVPGVASPEQEILLTFGSSPVRFHFRISSGVLSNADDSETDAEREGLAMCDVEKGAAAAANVQETARQGDAAGIQL
jgi:hypothetical protein